MVLYMRYKNYKTVKDDEKQSNVCSQSNSDEKGISDTQNEHEQKDQDVKTKEASNQGQSSVKCEV